MPQSPAGACKRVAIGECLLTTERMGGMVEEKWSHEVLWKKLDLAPTVVLMSAPCGDLKNCWLARGHVGWLTWLLLRQEGLGPWARLYVCPLLSQPFPLRTHLCQEPPTPVAGLWSP